MSRQEDRLGISKGDIEKIESRRAFLKGAGATAAAIFTGAVGGIAWFDLQERWRNEQHERWVQDALAAYNPEDDLEWARDKLGLLEKTMTRSLTPEQAEFCLKRLRYRYSALYDPDERKSLSPKDLEIIHSNIVALCESISRELPFWELPPRELRPKLETFQAKGDNRS